MGNAVAASNSSNTQQSLQGKAAAGGRSVGRNPHAENGKRRLHLAGAEEGKEGTITNLQCRRMAQSAELIRGRPVHRRIQDERSIIAIRTAH